MFGVPAKEFEAKVLLSRIVSGLGFRSGVLETGVLH